MANIAGRKRNDALTRLLADRTNLTPSMFKEIAKKYFKNCCAYCNDDQKPLTKEHVVTNKDFGTLEPNNVIPCCRECNDDKRERDWREYAKEKGSRFIKQIEARILGYKPLDLEELRNRPDPYIKVSD
ncbi:HNH endonuclease [Cohnella phaseoli]|uniref:HNH endonuclease n=1 Tax=Cohnella phaseoli TaxID=456490 RepID=UPI000E22A7DE|nr:HNH endonuclease [Cohnella phaseoli]